MKKRNEQKEKVKKKKIEIGGNLFHCTSAFFIANHNLEEILSLLLFQRQTNASEILKIFKYRMYYYISRRKHIIFRCPYLELNAAIYTFLFSTRLVASLSRRTS